MDTGRTPLADFRAEVAGVSGDAYVRAILVRDGATWSLYHASAMVGAEPPGWAEQLWRYELVAFAACVFPAAEAARLCGPAGGMVTLGDLAASVPAAQDNVHWARRPSFARHDHLQMPWPVTDYRISATDARSSQPEHEVLVAEGCPSFPEPQSAWRAFSEGDFSLTGALRHRHRNWPCSASPDSADGSAGCTSRRRN